MPVKVWAAQEFYIMDDRLKESHVENLLEWAKKQSHFPDNLNGKKTI